MRPDGDSGVGRLRLMTLARAVRQVVAVRPWAVVALCGVCLVQAAVPAGKLAVTKRVLDAVVAPRSGEIWQTTLVPLLVGYLGLLLVAAAATQFSAALRELLGERVVHGTSRALLEHASSLDLAHFENGEFYDRLKRAEQEALQRPVLVLSQLIQLLQSTMTFVSMVVVLLRFHWLVVVIMAATGAPQLLAQLVYGRRGHDLRVRQTQGVREMHYVGLLLTSVEAFKEVRVFRLVSTLLRKYEEVWQRLYNERRAQAIAKVAGTASTSSLSIVSYVAFYGYAVHRVVTGSMSVGDLVLYSGAYLQSQADLGQILNSVSGLYENGLFIQTFYQFLRYTPHVTSPPRALLPRRDPQTLEFRDVWFRYPGCSRWALSGVTFTLKRGESLALVGPNGAGKSTVIKLMCRLYDPQRGSILLDGVDVRSLDIEEYQRLVSVVFQDSVRYQFSAAMNIRVGRVEASEEEVRAAARSCGADAFIAELEDGYETQLGRMFDKGREISGGQWQKLAIARGCLRDGPIVIMDEPLSSLDATAEADVMARMQQLAASRLAMLVSHRMTHAAKAQGVLVLEEGRVVEEGDHERLLARGGLYTTLFRLQASQYQAIGTTVS